MGMDNAEAIMRIKDHIRIHGIGESPLNVWVKEALDVAVSSLEQGSVEFVHGRWVTDENGITYCGRCRVIDDYASVHNYCPICGARMDGDSQ